MDCRMTPKEIRESRGITKKHIYNLLGISRQSYNNKESGKTSFSALEIQKLCNEYGIPVSMMKL